MMGKSKTLYLAVGALVLCTGLLGWRNGLFGAALKSQAAQAVEVKAVQVVQRDTPLPYEFVGQVKAKDEIKILSKVSGNVVAKMVQGGADVAKGQPLFRVDNKQYQSAIQSARATLVKSQAALNNTRREVARYQRLAAVQGVAQQTLDTYRAQEEENEAEVDLNEANLQQAIEDEADTLIVSPVDGRIDVNDVSIGQYIAAGSTALATVSSLDPLWVQFSMSENEYLKLARQGNGSLPESFRSGLQLLLSDGSAYALPGRLEQIDKGVSDTTGTITLKASFDNPQHLLMPGMFAKVVAAGEVRPQALLVPQRAVKEVLDNAFVTVVTENNTAESRPVKLGEKVGNWWLVEQGLSAADRVVVEGIDKVKQGTPLAVTMVAADLL